MGVREMKMVFPAVNEVCWGVKWGRGKLVRLGARTHLPESPHVAFNIAWDATVYMEKTST